MNETKYYKIGYGCGCGEMEDYIIAHGEDEAMNIAWELAVENYESYEGLHGVRGMVEIAEEDYGVDLNEIGDDDILYEDIKSDYINERESSLDYWAEEISEKEYLIGIGELEDDDE